jgi:outer membrane protein OmpA-like peptidoglycan-associated protein
VVERPVDRARLGWWAVLVTVLVAVALAGLAQVRPGAPIIAVDPPVANAAPVLGPRASTAAALAALPVTFAADSAALSDPVTVQRVADVLYGDPAADVLIVGYSADTPGPPEVAQRLSERRAAAVADALVASGVDRARLTTSGLGEADPLPTTAASRRVEIRIR